MFPILDSEMELNAPTVHEQFVDSAQQRESAILGMWIFLATEVLFFGGLFITYTVYRIWYGQSFAEASHHLSVVTGAISSIVLLTSSLAMACAVTAARLGQRKFLVMCLLTTALLAITFLGLEGSEWFSAIRDGHFPGTYPISSTDINREVRLFFSLYFGMTGLHIIHVSIGVMLILTYALLVWRGWLSFPNFNHILLLALYWAFVDLVWVFLFPLLYLIAV